MYTAPTVETNAVKRDYKHMEVKPYASALGAEVHGVKLAKLTADQVEEIRWAITDHSAIFFRDQHLTPKQQEAFSVQLGEFGEDPFLDGMEDHPHVLRLVKEADEKSNLVFGGTWHSDWSFQEAPPSYTILAAQDIPPYGGDTLYASLYNAYDSLSPVLQKFCESLNVIHTAQNGYGDQMAAIYESMIENMKVKTGGEIASKMQSHPMIRVHPESGRKVLYITGVYSLTIEGMHFDEAAELLNFMQTKIVEHPLNLCRFRWEQGSVAMWDNRCTQHLPMADYKGIRRELNRTIIGGEPPVRV